MKTITGNLIHLAKSNNFTVIIHGCNAFCTMGSGIAKDIKQNFYAAYQADLATVKGDKNKMGTYSFAKIGGLTVVNAYTQYYYGKDGRRYVDYLAVEQCFRKIKNDFAGEKIGFPLIGAGLAGGDWQVIKDIISNELAGEDFTLVVMP